MLRRYDGYTTGVLETANQIYFTFGLALSISIYALSYNLGFFGQLRCLEGVEEYFFALMISLLGVADFSCGYFTLLTFWDTANAKYLYSYLRYPVLTAISLFLSSLRPFAFFGGFSPRKALVLDLGLVLGHGFFLCIYSSHHLSGRRKKIPRCYAVYDALARH